jgi:hypothetical protein
MHYTDSKRLDAKMRAVEDALSRIGEPITEAQAKSVAVLEDCECKDGMFALAATRRQLFAGTGGDVIEPSIIGTASPILADA